jgi:16S rRNA (cytosine1402-N4)-methyltransferase
MWRALAKRSFWQPSWPPSGCTAVKVSTFSGEVAQMLDPRPGGLYLDATFGTGSHSQAVLARCPEARLIAADRDPLAVDIASSLAEEHNESVMTVTRVRFSELTTALAPLGLHCLDGLTADLGVSTLQAGEVDNKRGLDLTKDGPLDLRYEADQPSTPTAADILRHAEDVHLQKIFRFIASLNAMLTV